ncbi:DUF2235 domain-containing protein [Rhizobium sp. S152]|uniref:DUF2235 domain-containing protein n=1 Tax=Rhizobium sp. S152 TaxID=3055038 RepID=UPI0025A94436|nr:DUF2235 domain-containing protein [Rhizobium sp. S152]MDM9629069.1 DUF2235 domain-containing protein [Rhizobium sp. S152]
MKKRLIICFDGTWNSADSGGAETNVAHIARSIHATKNTRGIPQIVLYLRGIGAAGLQIQRIVEGATGLGIDENIKSGYMFLAQNYLPGDEIYLFGFSRGAFTARSLAGLIGSCGLLKRQTLADLDKAWRYYRDKDVRSPEDFVRVASTEAHVRVTIQFMGVWDTVGALGVPSHLLSFLNDKEYGFHNTSPSKIVKNAYHALAVDEFRDEFVPTLWTGIQPPDTDIQQVWFAGAHADVGGGYKDRALADIPLIWMARMAEKCGLVIDWSTLPQGLDTISPRHDSRTSWSGKDRLTPTIRQVCETPIHVDFYETLYRPRNGAGAPVATINEYLHASLVERYGRQSNVSADDNSATRSQETYNPRNLAPFFTKAGVRKSVNVTP